MKAFLTWHDAAFREVHNLEELGESCVRLDSTLACSVTSVTVLTKYAVRFRYPGAPYEPDVEEAQEAMRKMRSGCSAGGRRRKRGRMATDESKTGIWPLNTGEHG
jgi:hypothetical protein